MALTTKTKLYIGFAIAAGVLMITALGSFLSSRMLGRRTQAVEHSYRVMSQLQELEIQLKNTRAGVRGFLVTRDSSYLASYVQSADQVQPRFEVVRSLTLDNPRQQERLDTLRQVLDVEMRLLHGLLRPEVRLSQSAIQTALDAERQNLRQIERLLRRAADTERRLLEQRRSAQEIYESLTPAVILLSAVVAVVVTLWLFWTVASEITTNEQLRRELASTNAAVAQRIGIIDNLAQQVASGDYKIKIKAKERDNLGSLANSLNRMTQTLDETFTSLEKRNQELDQFAYVASHDLKAPLRGVSTVVKWIEDELGHELSPKMREYFGMMKGRLTRLEDLINGLLAYARIGRTQQKLENVNVAELVQDVRDLVVPPTFVLLTPDALPTLTTDRLSLQQVFTNLISNAVKYHHRGTGTITVRCRELKNLFEFRVQDDGPGIAPEYHEKIFLMFQTLRDRHTAESTGIGLSIVKKIIDEQRGSIRVESSEGAGATFVFTWPKQPVAVPALLGLS